MSLHANGPLIHRDGDPNVTAQVFVHGTQKVGEAEALAILFAASPHMLEELERDVRSLLALKAHVAGLYPGDQDVWNLLELVIGGMKKALHKAAVTP